MAATGQLTKARPRGGPSAVTLLRIALIVAALVIWEGMARSGLLYCFVVPPLALTLSSLVARPSGG